MKKINIIFAGLASFVLVSCVTVNESNVPFECNEDTFFEKASYDKQGRIIYRGNYEGKEEKTEYSKKGKTVCSQDRFNYYKEEKYNTEDKLIYSKTAEKDWEGNTKEIYEEWFEYSKDGQLLHHTDSKGHELHKAEYDENGRELYFYNATYDKNDEMDFMQKKKFIYDKSGNLVKTQYEYLYLNETDEVDEWIEYDEKGNVIHYRYSDGVEFWYAYDERGNIIYEKDDEGNETWFETDEKGNTTHVRNSDGFEGIYRYATNSRKIYEKITPGKTGTNNRHETWYEYDEKGNIIHIKVLTNEIFSDDYKDYIPEAKHDIKYPYYPFFTDYTCKVSGTYEIFYEYKNGILSSIKDTLGNENRYNDKGNQIYAVRNKDIHTIEYNPEGKLIKLETVTANGETLTDVYEYDKKGNIIHAIDSNRNEYAVIYEFYSNGKIKSKTVYTEKPYLGSVHLIIM